jgi:hypothetical protein
MYNSLIITVDGSSYTFECHSYAKALEILASHWNLWETMETKPSIDSFELV